MPTVCADLETPAEAAGDDVAVTTADARATRTAPTLATALRAPKGRPNGLNFVRLALATAVIFGHASLSGRDEFPRVGEMGIGELAVAGFFAISGFLIAHSRTRHSWWPFLWNRALRIFPAFWVCLVVVAFVAAPLSTVATDRDWSPGSSVSYVIKNAALWIFQPGIADTLGPDRFPWWNGSLWTLFYEFMAYLAIGVVLSVGLARRRPVAVLGFCFLGVTTLHALAVGPLNVTGAFYVNTLQLGGFFLAGSLLWALREKVPVHAWLAALALAAFVLLAIFGGLRVLGPLPVAYLVLYLGAVIPIRISEKSDISYGVYVYAFPVEQLLGMAGFYVGGLWGFAIVATALTVPFAWASRLFIESPATELKTPARAG